MSESAQTPRLRNIHVVAAAKGSKESTLIYESLGKLGISSFEVIEHNRRGLPLVYNEVLDRFAGQDRIVVLVHSDVRICDVFIREKLSAAAAAFNIIGVVGSAQFDPDRQTPNFAWTIWPEKVLSGSVEQELSDGSSVWCAYGPTPRRCIAMDGVFLAIDMLTIGAVRFDTQFSFHLYDIDFCLSAHVKRMVLGTTNIFIHHASFGDFESAEYRHALALFRAKWSSGMPA
jgi:hypothetical protein